MVAPSNKRFLLESDKAAANGLATLDGSSKIPAGQIPTLPYIPSADEGVANGVATLGADSKIPEAQLPVTALTAQALGWIICKGFTRADVIAALDAAEAKGRHTVVYFPAGVYDLIGGLSLSGYSVVLRGAGAGGQKTLPTGTVFTASAQTGPVIDWVGWIVPTDVFTAQVHSHGFMVRGSGVADPTKNNVGMRIKRMSSHKFSDIAIRDTGGPCLELVSNPGDATYLCTFEDIILNTPVGAKTNDVPYFIADEPNGCTFRNMGLRSMSSSADVGVSGALRITSNGQYPAYGFKFDSCWVENLHVPTNGTIVAAQCHTSVFEDFSWHDIMKEAGATGTSVMRFTPPAVGDYGGNIIRGVIPGSDGTATQPDTGIDMRQSRNSIIGVKGYKGKNVTLAAGVTDTFIELAGAMSAATDPAVVDNSGNLTNTYIDRYLGTETIPNKITPAGYRTIVSGNYYGPGSHVPGLTALGAGLVAAIPFWVTKGFTANSIACEVTTGAAGSTVRLGIYNNATATDKPGTVLIDAGTVDASTSGVKEIAISQALTPGLYWLAVVTQGGAPTLRTVGNQSLTPVAPASFAGSSASAGMNMYYMTGVTGALTSWAGGSAGSSGYKVMVRAA